jgi:PAS domain S-box-containing protein
MTRLEKHAIVADVKIHSIMNAHQIAVWEADKTGKFTWASNEFLNLLGLSLEQIKGNGWLVGISQEDRDLVFEEWGAAIAQERDFYLTFSVGNNIPIKVLARGAFIKNAQGEINGFVGTLTRV